MIVISASGMATGGRVSITSCRDGNRTSNTILFTGFLVRRDARGDASVSGADVVKMLANMCRCARKW